MPDLHARCRRRNAHPHRARTGRLGHRSRRRTRQGLVRLGAEAPDGDARNRARRLFARTVDAPVGLRIDTIHAFCQSLLGRFPIEAGVSPWFQLADEREALTRQANARDAVLERRGEEIDGAVAEVADNLSEYNIRAFIAELLRNRSAFGPGALAALETALILPEAPERTKKATKALREAASILAGGGVTDKRHAASLQRWADAEAPSDDDIEEVRKVFYKSNGEPREELGTKNLAGRERLPGLLDEECERIERLREYRKIEATLNASRAALALGEAVDGEYRRSKGRAGLLDYDDLIESALGLLQSTSAAWVHYKLDRGIDHVLIDEAQDTSPAQWGLVEALTQEFFAGEGAGEEARTLFAVGDPKQSIYRFQGAEPKKFGDMRETFRTRAEGPAGAGKMCRWKSPSAQRLCFWKRLTRCSPANTASASKARRLATGRAAPGRAGASRSGRSKSAKRKSRETRSSRPLDMSEWTRPRRRLPTGWPGALQAGWSAASR